MARAYGVVSSELIEVLDTGSRTHGRKFDRHSNGALVSVFKQMLLEYEVNNLIELGAHRASTSRRFMREKKGRRALAVEANPFNFDKFKGQVEQRGVTYWNVALNKVSGPVDLILADGDMDRRRGHTRTTNSLLKRSNYGRTMRCEVIGFSFDDLIDRAVEEGVLLPPRAAPTALWVDLEGIVDRMIAGGAKYLPDCKIIFVEVEHEELFDGQVTFEKINPMFEELGFVAALSDCEYHPIQNNVIYVAREWLSSSTIVNWQKQLIDNLMTFDAM